MIDYGPVQRSRIGAVGNICCPSVLALSISDIDTGDSLISSTIYLILAIINYLIFCFDVEYHRDVMTWIWLGTAIVFSYAYHINRKAK